jgi:hypothetical protein
MQGATVSLLRLLFAFTVPKMAGMTSGVTSATAYVHHTSGSWRLHHIAASTRGKEANVMQTLPPVADSAAARAGTTASGAQLLLRHNQLHKQGSQHVSSTCT